MKSQFLVSIVSIFVFSASRVSAQSESLPVTDHLKNKHAIYAEVFGQGFSGSLNYDMLFNRNKRWKNSFSAGIIAIPRALDFGDGRYFGVMGSYNWLIGGKRNFLELGVGITSQLGENYSFYGEGKTLSQLYTYLTPKIGYRFQAYKSGLFFRATLTPQVSIVNTSFGRSGMNNTINTSHTFFDNVLNLDYPAFPWFGLSIGYSF